MRDLNELNKFRDTSPAVIRHFGSVGDGTCGRFLFHSRTAPGIILCVIASANAGGWDHVSVSTPKRCPNWYEMEQVKRMFFNEDEVAMQLHVPASDHISFHPNCLHLWRPLEAEIPLPPPWMVGPPKVEVKTVVHEEPTNEETPAP